MKCVSCNIILSLGSTHFHHFTDGQTFHDVGRIREDNNDFFIEMIKELQKRISECETELVKLKEKKGEN